MNGTLLLEKRNAVAKHCPAVFIEKLFKIKRSSGTPGIKEASSKRRKFKPHRNQ